jgi:hypothetical protein
MGIALGYAFLLALAGGLAAICFAWLLELAEDRRPSAENEPRDAPHLTGFHFRRSSGPDVGPLCAASVSGRPGPPHLSLTPK